MYLSVVFVIICVRVSYLALCVFCLYCSLVVSTSAADSLERFRNDLLCVEWDVKHYTLTHSLSRLLGKECAGPGICRIDPTKHERRSNQPLV